MADDDTVYVRYLIDDVETASAFYVAHLGFEVVWSAGAAFAEIARGNLHVLLSGPASSAARPMPDGRQPGPGGWNRIHLIVDDLASEVERLRAAGVPFRGEIVRGPGGLQIVFRRSVRQPRRVVRALGLLSDFVPARFSAVTTLGVVDACPASRFHGA